MTEEVATVPIDEEERDYIQMFRFALSERSNADRLKVIRLVRHDVTAHRLQELFESPEYAIGAGPEDYWFLRWAAETASERHEAAMHLMKVEERFQDANQRKLNIAEHIGLRVFNTVQDAEFKGIYVPWGYS